MTRKRATGAWESDHESKTTRSGDDRGLKAAVSADVAPAKWQIEEVKAEMQGGNRDLARAILDYQGKDSMDKKAISNMMRNLQRYETFERTGVRDKNSFAPSKAVQNIINRVGNEAITTNKSIEVSMSGDVSVNGYTRNRSVSIGLSGSNAASFLNAVSGGNFAAAWNTLASAYKVGEIHAVDASIDVRAY
jgi:hypothetical protein